MNYRQEQENHKKMQRYMSSKVMDLNDP